jgi:hypothetical protein
MVVQQALLFDDASGMFEEGLLGGMIPDAKADIANKGAESDKTIAAANAPPMRATLVGPHASLH